MMATGPSVCWLKNLGDVKVLMGRVKEDQNLCPTPCETIKSCAFIVPMKMNAKSGAVVSIPCIII